MPPPGSQINGASLNPMSHSFTPQQATRTQPGYIQDPCLQEMHGNERWRANLKRNEPALYQYVLDSLAGASGGLGRSADTQQMREMVCSIRRDRRREQARQQQRASPRYPQYPRPPHQFHQQQQYQQQQYQQQPTSWGVPQQTLPQQYMTFPEYPRYSQSQQLQQSTASWEAPQYCESQQCRAPQSFPQYPQSQHPAHYTTSWRAPQNHPPEQCIARSESPRRFQPQLEREHILPRDLTQHSKPQSKPQYPQPLFTPPDECIEPLSGLIHAQPQQPHQLPPDQWGIPGLAPFPPALKPRVQPSASSPLSQSSARTPDSMSVATPSTITPPTSPDRPFDWWEDDGPELWGHCRWITDLLRRFCRDPESVLSDDSISPSMKFALLRMTSTPESRPEQGPRMMLAFPWNVYSNELVGGRF